MSRRAIGTLPPHQRGSRRPCDDVDVVLDHRSTAAPFWDRRRRPPRPHRGPRQPSSSPSAAARYPLLPRDAFSSPQTSPNVPVRSISVRARCGHMRAGEHDRPQRRIHGSAAAPPRSLLRSGAGTAMPGRWPPAVRDARRRPTPHERGHLRPVDWAPRGGLVSWRPGTRPAAPPVRTRVTAVASRLLPGSLGRTGGKPQLGEPPACRSPAAGEGEPDANELLERLHEEYQRAF